MTGRDRPVSDAAATAPQGEGLDVGLLRAAHRNNLPTMVVQIAASIGVTVAAYHPHQRWYLVWLGVVLALAAGRLAADRVLARLLRQQPPPAAALRRWGAVHSAGLVLSSGLWALLAWLKLPVEDVQTRYVIIIILSALSGGAIGVLAPLRVTGRIYVALLLIPACARLLMDGGAQGVLGVLGLVFFGVMIFGHRNNHAILVRSLELGRENLSLVERLRLRAQEVEAINLSLEQRVAERTAALEALAVQAQAANRAKSEFLATISHEIRTPLNGVLGMVQVLERGALDDAQRGRVSVIRASAQMLLGIVNDVLDISKIEAGKMTLAPAAFRLDEFAEGLRRLYGVLAQEKGLDFSLTLEDTAPGLRFGDEVRLRQILSNLASNALKFTERGAIRIDIRADADTATLAVHDTGIGIAPQDQPQVFDKFVQADGSNTRRAGGTGLGLAICRDLATLMGGEIRLASTPGLGSTFTVTVPLPLHRSAPSSQAAAPAAEAPVAAADGPRVLIVDDNPTNRLVLQTLLEQFGVRAVTANDGVEAITAWAEADWDAILMDINMPVMDGLDATKTIRARENEVARPRTPIIAVTASVLSHETEAYRAAGMDDVVPKPVDAETLMDALARRITPQAA